MKLQLQELTKRWRKEVEPEFRPVDPKSGTIYALEEVTEAIKAYHRDLRPEDLRTRKADDKDPLAKELGQAAFMICSAATAMDVTIAENVPLPDVPGDSMTFLLLAAYEMALLSYCLSKHDAVETWHKQAGLQTAFDCVRRVAMRFNVDLEAEISAWMESVAARIARQRAQVAVVEL